MNAVDNVPLVVFYHFPLLMQERGFKRSCAWGSPPPSLLFFFSFGGKLIYSKCQTKRKSRCASARICIGKEREKKKKKIISCPLHSSQVHLCLARKWWNVLSIRLGRIPPPPPFCFVFFFSFFHRLFIWSSCISDVFSFSTSYEKDKKKKISWCWQLASVISLPLSLFKFHF